MLHRVTARLREALARRKKYNRILRSSQARQDDLVDALEDARAEAERQQRIITRRRKRNAPEEKIERTADRLEYARSVVDELLERLDNRRDKNERVRRVLQQQAKRVQELRRRRKRILTEQQNNIGKYWHFAEFDCRIDPDCPDYMKPHCEDHARWFLDKLRERFGPGHINSGHRWQSAPPAAFNYNASVGGVWNSNHAYEVRKKEPATDLRFATGTPSQWAAYARQLANQLGFGGVGQYATFIHVDPGPRRDWWG